MNLINHSETITPFEIHFDQYINAYLIERNLSKTAALFADSFSGFGTGLEERSYNKAEAMLLFKNDIESVPDPIEVHFHKKHFLLIDPDNALVTAELDMETVIMEQRVKFNFLRMLLIMHRFEEKVEIVGMHLSFPTDVHGDDESFPLKELEERTHILRRMVEEQTKSLKEAYDELTNLINRDHLTQVSSRYYFEEVLKNEETRYENFNRDYALILLDIDDFKNINDQYGHSSGDDVLKAVAATIRKIARKTDIVARWGGDEFVILMPETDLKTALAIGEAISEAVKNGQYPVESEITVSMGLSTALANGAENSLFKSVDEAMYQAKKAGKKQNVCEQYP